MPNSNAPDRARLLIPPPPCNPITGTFCSGYRFVREDIGADPLRAAAAMLAQAELDAIVVCFVGGKQPGPDLSEGGE